MLFFKPKQKLNLESLQKEFDKQTATLLDKNYPDMLGLSPEDFKAKLELLWKSLEAKANDLKLHIKGQIPLLIVITANASAQMEKIKAYTHLDLNNLKKEISSEPNFYLLLDVEDGRNMVAKSPQDSIKQFQKQERQPFTLFESIALLTHYPDTLKNNYLTVCGTFYSKDAKESPLLWLLDDDKNPELHYAWPHIAHGSYGSGSSATKIIN